MPIRPSISCAMASKLESFMKRRPFLRLSDGGKPYYISRVYFQVDSLPENAVQCA